MKRASTILGIQYLRGLAALGVFIFHLGEMYDFKFSIGPAGVDIFFIISGFVMWVTTCNKNVDFIDFIKKRIQRLVPLYWIATLVTAGVALAKPSFFWGIFVDAAGLVKSLLFIPYYSSDTYLWPILIQGWTLNLEMFFYLFFAAALFLPLKNRAYVLTLVFAVLVVMGFVINFENPIFILFTRPLLLEFIAGVWLGILVTKRGANNFTLGASLLVLGLISFALLWSLGAGGEKQPQWSSVWAQGAAALLLVYGMVIVETSKGMPYNRFLMMLGDTSYSVYLWHSLIMVIIAAIFMKLGLPRSGLTIATVGALSLALSVASYYVIEKPIIEFFKKRRNVPSADQAVKQTM